MVDVYYYGRRMAFETKPDYGFKYGSATNDKFFMKRMPDKYVEFKSKVMTVVSI